MALTKETITDKIEIVGEFKILQIREAVIVKEDGVEISRTAHRKLIAPGQSAAGESAEIQALVAMYHTPDVVSAYEASQA